MKIYMGGTIGGISNSSFASCEGSGPFAAYHLQEKEVKIIITYPSIGERCPQCGLLTWIDATPWPMTWREDLLQKQGFSNLRCIEVGRIEKAGHGKMKPYREQADYDFWKPDEYVPLPPKEKSKKRVKKQ